MDEDSFNPRNWANAKPDPAAAASQGANRSALPEAWREVVADSPPGPARQPAQPQMASPKRATAIPFYAASLAMLLAGASAAWLTRGPAAGQTAGIAAAPVAEAPAAAPDAVERTLNLGSIQDIAAALLAAGVSQADATAAAAAAAAVLTAPGEIRAVIRLVPSGGMMTLERLQASFQDGSGAIVARNTEGIFQGSAVAAELTRQVKVLRGELDSESFYSSAVAAGVLDTLIPEFINAFAFDFNLASEISPGDTFEVAWEQSVNPQGQPVGQPQLLFASLTTPTKSRALYRFVNPDGQVGWYDGHGGSTKRGLMRTPVDGARITSKFGPRFHPVLHYNRLHAGVDFGVPIGTAVYAAADGVVIGSSPTGCGGNMAVLQHDNGWVTRYFHLSRFAPGLQNGQRVTQGFTVGQSGNTGSCTTGPHLHYELRIEGEPVDPMGVPTSDAEKKLLEGSVLQTFLRQRDRVDVARAQQAV